MSIKSTGILLLAVYRSEDIVCHDFRTSFKERLSLSAYNVESCNLIKGQTEKDAYLTNRILMKDT
jgi:hypothetical protein